MGFNWRRTCITMRGGKKGKLFVTRTLFRLGIFLLPFVFIRTKIIRVGDEFIADFKLIDGNKRIKSNCIGNFTQASLPKCVYKCIRNESCQTFNHHERLQICEILNISKFDQVGLLENSRGWNHYETDCNERKNGAVCKKGDLCEEYETCEDTFDNKLYKCRCPDGYDGTKCKDYIGRGSSESNPSPACSLIISKYANLPDGFYWIKKKNSRKAVKKYCRRKGTEQAQFWTQWSYCEYGETTQTRERKCHDPRTKDSNKRNCEDEMVNRTCTHTPVSSCREIKERHPSTKSGLYTLSSETTEPIKVYCDMETGSAVSSCREIKERHPSTKSGLYTLSSKTTEPIKVYCDMETGSGGWLLIGNLTIEQTRSRDEAMELTKRILSTDIKELYKAHSEQFLFDALHLRDLNDDFSQARFYCQKDGKIIHIKTRQNAKHVVDFFLLGSATRNDRPIACGTFDIYLDDNSYISRHCEEWKDGNWGRPSRPIMGIYFFPFYIHSGSHFALFGGRLECDDYTGGDNNQGVWHVYVR